MTSPDLIAFVHEGLGNSSYLLRLDKDAAVMVDPDRNAGRYLRAAEERGWRVVGVLETHLHADFVTGSLEIRHATSVPIHIAAAADAAFEHRGVEPGERFEVGDVEVEAVATPGHTPEHLAYVVRSGAPTPRLFSGGALIAGGAARTDLISPDLTESLTRAEFRTLHHALSTLPDETELLPTHGGGSFCSVASATGRTSTLGIERATNPLMAMSDEDEFVQWWPSTFPGVPAYFSRMRELNRNGPRPTSEIPMPEALAPARFEAARRDGALVVDCRSPDQYAAGHIEGSLSIAFREAYSTWLGWLVEPDATLLLVTGEVAVQAVVDASLLVGYERFAGFLLGGLDAWRRDGRPLRSLPSIGPEDAVPWLRTGAQPLDVREPDEFELGHMAGAVLVPLGNLARSAEGLPAGRPLLAYCGSGVRSMTAASILERLDVGPVVNLRGGYGAWTSSHRD